MKATKPGMRFTSASELDETLANFDAVPYASIPAAAYHATRCVSHSMLKKMADSPSKFIWEQEHPRPPTPALTIGTAVHTAILEPDLFDQQFCTRGEKPKEQERPDALAGVRRKPKGKEADCEIAKWEATWKPQYDADLAAWEARGAGKTVLSQDDMDMVMRIHARAYDCGFFRQFFDRGEKEKSFFIRHDLGLNVRIRPDNVVETDAGLFIVDLKTTTCAQEHVFTQDITTYSYLTQAALYCDIFEKATGVTPDGFVIVAVEKSRDCDMQAYYFEGEDLDVGRRLYTKWLTQYANCVREKKWPGYPRKFIKYKAPDWLVRKSFEK